MRFRRARRASDRTVYPPDLRADVVTLIERVRPYTMTSVERVNALVTAVDYVVSAGVPGAIVECGVWRGGSMMAAALRLMQHGSTERELVLFDTFEGMPDPGDEDVDLHGLPARRHLERDVRRVGEVWAVASRDDVAANLATTAYPNVRLVEGRVEDTVPREAPTEIAILRLDTDWYDSTRHELEHLVPRVAPGGVLIIDDYGHWEGARRAVDEYVAQHPLLLARVDYTGRVAIIP